MKKILFTLCALSLLLLPACEKDIEFKGEIMEPRLTLSAQATVGETFSAYVASSIFFLEQDPQGKAFTEGLDTLRGRVRCFVNDEPSGREMRLQSGESGASLCYASDYVPAPGDHIRLEAEFPGFDPVQAAVTVPKLPHFELLSVERRRMDLPASQEYYEAELTLAVTDDGSYDKYYFLQPLVSYQSSMPWWDGRDTILTPLTFTSDDILFGQAGGTDFGGTDFFSDAPIKGKRHVFKITVQLVPSPDVVTLFGLKLAAADENLYWYDTSYTQLRWSFGGLFSEAVSLYSNVHGGYGILCSIAPSWQRVEW